MATCACCDVESLGGGPLLTLAYGIACGVVLSKKSGTIASAMCDAHRVPFLMAMVRVTAALSAEK